MRSENKSLWFFAVNLTALFLLFSPSAFCQSPYAIDVSKQTCLLKTGFVKMGTSFSPSGERLSYNNFYLTKNNKPWFPIMGEMHFSRTLENDWEESIIKMKSCGIEAISTYVIWNFHEEQQGIFDWTGERNLRKFLEICKVHDMKVWLRIGPWSHAEIKYGGFPGWLINMKIPLRKNDSTYLHFSEIYFNETAKQCKGLLFKDGGPVIGVQIENELEFKNHPAYEHMKTLKKLAIDAGFDVPYYTAFAAGPDDQDEFLITLGGYPDSPWAQHTKKMFKPLFFIKPLENDSDMGIDLFGHIDSRIRNTYPKLGAEMGGGLQPYYHRRVDVSFKDIGAVAYSRIASGLNGIGYYVFHGGVNPVGKTGSLQESRVSNYPNDLCMINYDYLAPIGAMGILSPSYNDYKILHSFLKDFGDSLCTKKTFFPEKVVSSVYSTDTIKASVRINNNSGFIFLSNYQRNVPQQAIKNFQLKIINNGKVDLVPEKPVEFPADEFTIWPYQFYLNDIKLNYATAQLFCKLENKEAVSYVFSSKKGAEFVVENKNIKTINANKNCSIKIKGHKYYITCKADEIAVVELVSQQNKKIVLINLNYQTALNTSKINFPGKEVLMISNGNIFWEKNKLTIDKVNENGTVDINVYPEVNLRTLTKNCKISKAGILNGIFTHYQLVPLIKTVSAKVEVKKDENSLIVAEEIKIANQHRDSIIEAGSHSKFYNTNQPGPIYEYKYHDLPGQAKYNLQFIVPGNDLIKDWIATLKYQGDVMALYNNDTLVYDQFNYADSCNFRLGPVMKIKNNFTLQILPTYKYFDIYVEDKFKEELKNEWMHPLVRAIKLTPVYSYKLEIF